MGYTKLFNSLIASTIWRADDKTRLVWITMLAMKNERHLVEASVPGLADLARVTLGECEAALKKLSSPDKWSRSKECEGRRIREVAGGWEIINGEHYRKLMSQEDRKEYQRNYHRQYRKEKKQRAAPGGPLKGETAATRAMDNGDENGADRITEDTLPKGGRDGDEVF